MKRLFAAVIPIVVLATVIAANASLPTPSSSSATITLFESDLVGVPTGLTGAAGAIRGVNGAGAPWRVAGGSAELASNGKLEVDIVGLVLNLPGNPRDGTTGAVTGVRASLTCQGSNVVATTAVEPLSAAGNAKIEETIALAGNCVGPIILIRIDSTAAPWIAATGFS